MTQLRRTCENHCLVSKKATGGIRPRFRLLVILISVLMMGVGCQIGPRVLPQAHWDYNQAVRQSNDEQLLLNIVRLKYDELPMFLEVSGITSSFSLQRSLGASASVTETVNGVKVPSTLGLNSNLTYSETPTISWSLPESREFLGRLMAPMGADQLSVLAQAGWGESRVFSLGIKKMNGLRNRNFTVSEGIYEPDTYEEFLEVLSLLSELRKDGLIDLAYSVYSNAGAAFLSRDQLDSRAIPAGLAYGLQFMTRDDPNVVEPLKLSKPLFVLFSKVSDTDARAQRVRQLLRLRDENYSFAIRDATESSADQLRTESGKVVTAFDPDAKFKDIVLNNRSVLEILYFASNSVEMPGADERSGTSGLSGLRILSSRSVPSGAYLRIHYRGHWFYIQEDDSASRDEFTLLQAIYAATVGSVPGAKPLLTLPVK